MYLRADIQYMRRIEYSVSSSCINYCPRAYKTINICRSITQIVTIANGFTQVSMKQPSLKFASTNFKQQRNLNSQNTNFYILHYKEQPIPSAARSEVWVWGRSLLGITGSNPDGGRDVCLLQVFVLSGRGLCFGLITRPEESYRLWCVVVCDLET
jgi:hypothetical protein